MSYLKIETGIDNEILRAKSKLVDKVDKKIKKLIVDMVDTLEKAEGLGLAAPQVGTNKRIILTRLYYGTDDEMVIVLINPKIVTSSSEKEFGEEGCLSIPGVYKPVKRNKSIHLEFMDLKGATQALEFEGLNARIIQHEIDHLDGVLFVDLVDNGGSTENDMSMLTF